MKAGTGENSPKKKGKTMGRTVSFQPTDEVRRLLSDAKDAGLELSEIINDAISKKGPGVATAMAEERKRSVDGFLSKHKRGNG